jgi:FixJ family two-component response regulator
MSDKPCILIADDNHLICQIMADALSDDYAVKCVYNGISALEHIVNWQGTDEAIACLIIDVMMPGMDGLELLRKLHDMNINLPVVVISGQFHQDHLHRMEQYGVMAFLDKPIRARTIRQAVPHAIQAWSRRHETDQQPDA